MNLFVVVEPAVGQMDGLTIIFFSLRTLYSTQYQIQKVEVEIRKTTSIDSINSTLSLGSILKMSPTMMKVYLILFSALLLPRLIVGFSSKSAAAVEAKRRPRPAKTENRLLLPLHLSSSQPGFPDNTIDESTGFNTSASISEENYPPPPEFIPKPLPVLLGGGLFLFAGTSSMMRNKHTKKFVESLLDQATNAMNADASIIMELGQGIEAKKVYSASPMFRSGNYDQLVLQFQIEGGNAWAQGVAYGVRSDTSGIIQLVSLEVANMDASMNGIPLEIKNIPTAVQRAIQQ